MTQCKKAAETIVGKEENTAYQYFLLLPLSFP